MTDVYSRDHLHGDAERAAAPFPPLLAEAERIASAASMGVHGRRRPGVGETFWEYRAYQPSDSAQRVDWRRSARSDRLYVRENEWEAANTVLVWRNAGAGMDYRSATGLPTKRRRAEVLALALAILLDRGGERVGLLGSPEPPASGRAVVRRIAEELEHGAGADAPERAELPRHAFVVMISDFFAPMDELERRIGYYARAGARGALLQVLDPAETAFPFSGRTLFKDMMGADDMLFGRAQSAAAAYRAREAAHRDALQELARRVGWRCSAHWTDRSPQTPLLALYSAIAGESASGRRRA